jgi:hypothetical protein
VRQKCDTGARVRRLRRAVAALARVGDTIGALVFGVLVATHLALTFALDQRA